MKVLVTVASKHGSTREIAEAVAGQLRNAQIEVDLRDVSKVQVVEEYGAVILGSAVYAGSWLPEAKKFAERHHGELTKRPVWLFSSGPLGAPDPQPQDDQAKFAAPLGEVPVRDHRVFVGKLNPAELGFTERVMVKVVKAPYGDFRDWEEIRGWARQVAADIHSEFASAAP